MRIHVVSDVHGNADALARAGDGADALLVLGDLLDFVDYHDHSRGILGQIFGSEKVARFARLRTGHDRGDIAEYARSLWEGLANPAEAVDEAIRDQYAKLFAAMTAPTYATPGNVDAPEMWPEFAGHGIHVLDGEGAEIAGLRFGFVGGGLLPSGARLRRNAWTPYLRTPEDFDASVAALPPVDVLCSHIPPAVPDLAYDVVARRGEAASIGLLDRIRSDRPRFSLFGHVHQPLTPRVRLGPTECVNVGHFQRTEAPYVLEL